MPIVLLFCSEVGKAPDAPAGVSEMVDTPPTRDAVFLSFSAGNGE